MFGPVNGNSTHQNRPALIVKPEDLLHYRVEFFFLCPVDAIGKISPDKRLICRHHHYIQLVDGLKFIGLGKSGPGHPG